MSSRCSRVLRTLPLLVAMAGCSEPEFEVIEASEASWTLLECDPIVPEVCGLPFPSNVYTVADASTPTGRRLQLSLSTMPRNDGGVAGAPDVWNRADGFSASAAIMTHMPGLTQSSLEASGVATPDTIERSLEFDSPTILIDVETLDRVPHWIELDATADSNDERVLLIRPAMRLENGRRYVVAIRRLVGDDGEALPPSDVFGDLRDGFPSDDSAVRGRRALYENIFKVLESDDVLRYDLQVAWDFTTASRESNTSTMVHMRDTALELVGAEGPAYRITDVDDAWETEHIAYRLQGEMQVPWFLDRVEPGALLVLDETGMPTPNPNQPWAWVPFEVLVPQYALAQPAPLLQYGHDLFGGRQEIEGEDLRTFADDFGYVLFAVDFLGAAAEDEAHVQSVLTGGRLDRLTTVVARQHQGMVSSLLAMRMMKRGFSQDELFGSMVDAGRSYYHGKGQGGILGATYLALSTDVERGALAGMGQPQDLLMSRSVALEPQLELLRGSYSDHRDVWMVQALAQILGERILPSSYSAYLRGEDVLPDTPNHDVLLQAALGDHQVTTLGAQVMARTMGVTHLQTGLREIYGMPVESGTVQGSAYVEYDFGLPPDPVVNLPQRECNDPHDELMGTDAARRQIDVFLRTGRVEDTCEGTCRFLGGCPL